MNDTHDQLSSQTSIEISVVMPCLNEAETLLGCIQEASQAIKKAGVNGEIVIADNGSNDGSQQIAENAGARVVNIEKKGYGSALQGGIKAAKGTFVIMGDADGSYDFGELPTFLDVLRKDNDLVMGCRLPKGGGVIEPGAMPWKHRWIGNPVLSGLGKLFFKTSIDDFHCGLRAFRREAILDLNLESPGMEFASEMVVRSFMANLKIDQVPITLRPDGRSRKPHLRSWRDGWRHLRFMLLFSPKWLFVMPGLLLASLGLIGFFLLMSGPITIGSMTFDTNTLLVCAAAILVGFQALSFSVFTKVFAVREGLLPDNNRVAKLFSRNPVKWGAGLGSLLLIVGIAYLLIAINYWSSTGFGNLPYAESLRIVIPAITAIALGAQLIFSGFGLAVLGLGNKSNRVKNKT